MIMTRKPRVVVLGGGFGGLEAAFSIRSRLGDRVEVELISDRDTFLFKPNLIYVPFGLKPDRLLTPINAVCKNRGVIYINAAVTEIDLLHHTVRADGQWIGYDYLIVATGPGTRRNEIPGFDENARTVWNPDKASQLHEGFQQLLETARAKQRNRVLFLVPPNNRYSPPIYELALMLDTWLRQKKARNQTKIALATFEQNYIQDFGPRLDFHMTEEFARRDIDGHKKLAVEHVHGATAAFASGTQLRFDLLVSMPPHSGTSSFPGLPCDERGFIRTDLATRKVLGCENVFAVGDVADFPVKQAYLAKLQADAAAEQVAASVSGTQPESVFEPISLSVMEHFDKATFAQVPLRMTGRPESPIETTLDDADYRVGDSRLWRLGKKLLGGFVPWRFGAGAPLHAGLPGWGWDAGTKMMSQTFAD
jgi:NADH dehydrogenase FAD-containing subunit